MASALGANAAGRHVAVVTTSYPHRESDAAGHFVQSECRALARAGNRVTVITPGAVNRTPGDHGIEFLTVGGASAFGFPGALERLRANPLRVFPALAFCAGARRALFDLDPDEIVAHWLLPSLLITDGHPARLTAVAHGSDVRLLRRLPPVALRASMTRWLAQPVHFRFVAERLRRELVQALDHELGRRLLAQSHVLPCAFDVDGVPARSDARARLELDERFVAVCVGRLVSGKRVDWALTHAPVPEGARFVVVGDGPEREKLERAFPRVEFKGALAREEALTWIAAADVLISSSESEGAPTAIREARSLGTPVWTNDVGDVRLWAERDPGIRVMDRLTPR